MRSPSSFMPKPGELRQLAVGDRAENAWLAVVRAVQVHSGYNSVRFDDPVISHVIVLNGGWERINDLPKGDFDVWLRKRFIDDYNRMAGEALPNLVLKGIFDRQNPPQHQRPARLVKCGYMSGPPAIEQETKHSQVAADLTAKLARKAGHE